MAASSVGRLGGSRTGSAKKSAYAQPKSLTERLSREFAAPVGLYDPITRNWLARVGHSVDLFPDIARLTTPSKTVCILPASNTAEPVWLSLPLPRLGSRELSALVGFAPRNSAGSKEGWGPSCPDRALLAWGQNVVNQIKTESEVPAPSLADRLIRRFRVSDSPDRFQRKATAAVLDSIGVEVVAWIPSSIHEKVVLAGMVDGLEEDDYRRLLPALHNLPLGSQLSASIARRSGLRRIVLVPSGAESPSGWLLAANPSEACPLSPDVVEILQTVASLIGTQRANARLYSDLKELLFGVIRALTSAIDAKDRYTAGHSERVARIAVLLGEQLGMTPAQRGDLYLMGLLHDVGKIGVEDYVLKKPDKLTDEEYRMIQSHVEIGVMILTEMKKLHHLLPGVAHHHESLDGTGYPKGLAGEAIPFPARILAAADAYDAMSSDRPYRNRLTPRKIDEILRKGSGVQWDPKIIDALFACRSKLETICQKGIGESLVAVVDQTLEGGRG